MMKMIFIFSLELGKGKVVIFIVQSINKMDEFKSIISLIEKKTSENVSIANLFAMLINGLFATVVASVFTFIQNTFFTPNQAVEMIFHSIHISNGKECERAEKRI